jgi:hypothetical protein
MVAGQARRKIAQMEIVRLKVHIAEVRNLPDVASTA